MGSEEEKIHLNYEESMKTISEMIKMEEEHAKYYLSLFLDEEELHEIDDTVRWDYVGKLKEISNEFRTYRYEVGDELTSLAFYGNNEPSYLMKELANIESLRSILSTIKVYGKEFGEEHIAIEFDKKTGEIKIVSLINEMEELSVDKWDYYLERILEADKKAAIEYIKDVESDKNVEIIKKMMDIISPESSKIYDNIITSTATGKALDTVSVFISAAEVPIARKIKKRIKNLKIKENSGMEVVLDTAITKIVEKHLNERQKIIKKDDERMYG